MKAATAAIYHAAVCETNPPITNISLVSTPGQISEPSDTLSSWSPPLWATTVAGLSPRLDFGRVEQHIKGLKDYSHQVLMHQR